MTQINDGGPAFPFVSWQSPNGMVSTAHTNGMTLRDWFAGQALAGLLANVGFTGEVTYDGLAYDAYRIADAMLAAREAKP